MVKLSVGRGEKLSTKRGAGLAAKGRKKIQSRARVEFEAARAQSKDEERPCAKKVFLCSKQELDKEGQPWSRCKTPLEVLKT